MTCCTRLCFSIIKMQTKLNFIHLWEVHVPTLLKTYTGRDRHCCPKTKQLYTPTIGVDSMHLLRALWKVPLVLLYRWEELNSLAEERRKLLAGAEQVHRFVRDAVETNDRMNEKVLCPAITYHVPLLGHIFQSCPFTTLDVI